MTDEAAPRKSFTIAGLQVPRLAVYAAAVVVLYLAGMAFAVGYSGGDNSSPAPTDTRQPDEAVGRCWDGSGVARGERCSTDYDASALFWAFGLDDEGMACDRSEPHEWSAVGLSCEYKGAELRLAIWRTADARDQRLVEYGKGSSAGRGLILHPPGEADRTLVRYDSDKALLYASVKDEDAALLNKLLPKIKSRTELLNGSKAGTE
jgi:hypothetical protein